MSDNPLAPSGHAVDDDDTEQFVDLPDQAALTGMTALAREMLDLDVEIAAEEAKLAKLQEKRRQIAERQLPDAMVEAGTTLFKLSNGPKVELVAEIYGNITKPNLPNAVKWLAEKNHSDIVKQNLSANFTKGSGDFADVVYAIMRYGFGPGVERAIPKLTELLEAAAGKKMNPDVVRAVLMGGVHDKGKLDNKDVIHPQTLNAFVREMVRKGEELPPSIDWFERRVVKITLPATEAT